MDPIMFRLGPLTVYWYGFFIATAVFAATFWATKLARQRGLDAEKFLDMVVYLVIGGIIGARLIYVLTSPSAYFGPNGNPMAVFYTWEGGLSFHGAVLGLLLVLWIYARIHKLNMLAYLDIMTPAAALGIMGGRLGNFMNGTDTSGRLTNWPIGFTWPEPGTDTFGAFGRFFFTDNLWAGFPGICTQLAPNGSHLSLSQCLAAGGEIVRGPLHLTQIYGFMVGLLLLFILVWALRRSRTPGYVFWQFVFWYSLLRFVLEEPFRDNPVFWQVFITGGGLDQPGIGLFTLTQLISIPLMLIAIYMLLVMNPDQAKKRELLTRKARGR
jgi:phosphatidylglycerol:prolipoprotein diacylglycerol transferase